MYRLVLAVVDYLKPSVQTALVPADNGDDARRIAAKTDPLGQDWQDPVRFVADSIFTSERHVIGDVVFKSVPVSSKLPKYRKG
jgi:hypothetical protein